MVHDADHQEQRRLVERVHHQEQHCGHDRVMGARADEHGQRAKRHQRGIGQHLLDVGLAQRHDRGKDRRDAAEQRQDPEPRVRPAKRGVHARHQEDARLDHRRAVQIGRHRRRRSHRVGQPEMERHLRRFRERARQEQQQDRQIPGMRADHVAHRQDLRQLERAGDRAQHDQPRQQDQPARPRHQQRLKRRPAGVGIVGVEPDQQVRGDGRDLPEHEQHDQVVGQHQAQHADHEHQQIADEPRIVRVIAQIARRIQRDRRADPGDQQGEGHGQPVQQHRQVDPKRGHPFDAMNLRSLRDFGQQSQEIQEQDRRERDRDPARRPSHDAVHRWIVVSHVSNPCRGMQLADGLAPLVAGKQTLEAAKSAVATENCAWAAGGRPCVRARPVKRYPLFHRIRTAAPAPPEPRHFNAALKAWKRPR